MSFLHRLVAIVVCLGLLASAALALAAIGGSFSPSLDVLTHFAPIYFAVGAAGALLALGFRPPYRSIALGLAAVAMIGAGSLIAPELASNRAPVAGAGEHRLKIIQFNAWGGNQRVARATAWILAQEPDVIVLQEGGRLEYELQRLGGYYISCANCHSVILSKAAPIFSNTPASWRVEPPWTSIATLADPLGPITVFGVHRHWPNRTRLYATEMRDLRALVATYPKRDLIVSGDFNSTPWSFARRREDRELGLTRRTRALFSWPAERVSHNRLPMPFPIMPIDHIYAGPGWVTVKTERGPKLGSDHYPVVVILARATAANMEGR